MSGSCLTFLALPGRRSSLLDNREIYYLLFFNLITIFTIRPAIRLRLTRIIRDEEKRVAMEIRGLWILNEMIRIYMPKIKKDNISSEDRKRPNHQKKGFIKPSVSAQNRVEF